MDDIVLSLVVILGSAVLTGLILLIVRLRQRQGQNALAQMALERGWRLEAIQERLAWGIKLSSAEWRIEAISRAAGRESSPGSSDVAMQTSWRAEGPGSTLLVGPRTSSAKLGALGDSLAKLVLEKALGADARGLEEIEAGSQAFRTKYMLWAQEAEAARRLVNPALESALANWKGTPPVIRRSAGELAIELHGARLTNPTEIQALVQLGDILLAWQGRT
ncbi:MAG: hypothetical protein MUE67_13145 [Anaerolineales bacterium]|jgi:hypothetical protein|nr:hypothetical protein [Anaerolineales bacterium]